MENLFRDEASYWDIERAHSRIFDLLFKRSMLPGAPPKTITTLLSTASWVATEIQTEGWF